MRQLIAAAIVLVNIVTPSAALTIHYDDGGYIKGYESKYKRIARTGEKVIIDGQCNSACTLVFQYVPIDQICATPRGSLGLHRFWWEYPNGRRVDHMGKTKAVVAGYPQGVQAWINKRGGYQALPSGRYWRLQGSDLAAIVKPC